MSDETGVGGAPDADDRRGDGAPTDASASRDGTPAGTPPDRVPTGEPASTGGTETESNPEPSADSFRRETTVIARTVVRVVVPIIALTAIGLLFQGHNRPGGGFIGGVLTATAFVLVYVVFGIDYLRSDLLGLSGNDGRETTVEGYRWLFAGGLAVAVASGLAPLVAGLPFLTQAVLFLEGVPLYGEFELASAFAFDVGVYLTVVGGLLTVLGEVGAE